MLRVKLYNNLAVLVLFGGASVVDGIVWETICDRRVFSYWWFPNITGENAQDVRFRNYGAWMHLNSDPEVTKILPPPIRKDRLTHQVFRTMPAATDAHSTFVENRQIVIQFYLPTMYPQVNLHFTNRKDKNNGRYQTI